MNSLLFQASSGAIQVISGAGRTRTDDGITRSPRSVSERFLSFLSFKARGFYAKEFGNISLIFSFRPINLSE